jgi:ADP-heptose:LPS heptosyltransferase
MQNLLFVELLGGIGDVLIALSAIQALGRSHPQAKLTVLTFAPGGELLQADPLIHQVIYADRSNPRHSIEQLLTNYQFDLIVSDTNYDGIDQTIRNSGAPRTVTNLWRSPPADERVGDRFLQILLAERLIAPEAIAAPQLHLTEAEQQRARSTLGDKRHPLVFLCPDAGMEIKCWPLSNFVALGQTLQSCYRATVLVPVGADLQQAAHIVTEMDGAAYIWPRGDLRELAAAIACADLVVAADTGLAHIAAALNVPTITLFGPSWHGRYGQSTPHINLQGYPECPERNIANFTEQSCWYSGLCPFDWSTCLEAISPADVLTAAAPFLEAKADQKKGKGAEKDSSPASSASPAPLHPYSLPKPALTDQWANARNILVIRLDNIGDVIMTSPALRAIKENLPQAHLTLMASPGGAQAAPLLPWVDGVLPWRSLWQDLGSLDFNPAREWQLVEMLRERHFDAAIIFTSFSQSPHPAGFLCHLAGIPLRLGASKEVGGVLTTEVPAAPDQMHQVEHNLQLLEAVGFRVSDRSLMIQIPEIARQTATTQLGQQGLRADSPYLLLNSWTSCQSRNYAPDRFATAARQLAEITSWPIVVTGVPKDRDRSGPLLEVLGSSAIDLIGKTTLLELAALIAGAQLVLTNNTSTMHLADATHTPSVVLFSGTEYESQWRPRHGPSRLLRQPTACSPCYAFTCPYNLECLDIPPTQVVEAGRSLLQLQATPKTYSNLF